MNDWRDNERAKADTVESQAREADPTKPVWFITGASSGFGRSTAKAALARGFRVVAAARRLEDIADLGAGENYLAVRLDLHDTASITAAVSEGERVFGHIDVLFNNAGTATIGAIEELTDDLLRQQLETNLIGPLAVVRAALPLMRERLRGHILQMSSMGGRCAFPGLGAYHASKFALEGASIALAQEVAPFGIRVTLIEPGDFRTPVLAPQRLISSSPLDAYAETVGQMRVGISDLDGTQPGDPDRLAQAVIAITETTEPPVQLALGPDCFVRLEAQLEAQLASLRQWAHLTNSTDLDSTSPVHA